MYYQCISKGRNSIMDKKSLEQNRIETQQGKIQTLKVMPDVKGLRCLFPSHLAACGKRHLSLLS